MCLVNVFASIIAAKFGACRRYDVRLMNNDGAPPESRQHFVETEADRDFWHLLRSAATTRYTTCHITHLLAARPMLCGSFHFPLLHIFTFAAVALALEAWASLIAFLVMRHIHKSSPAQSGSTHNKSTKAFGISQSGQGSTGRSGGICTNLIAKCKFDTRETKREKFAE